LTATQAGLLASWLCEWVRPHTKAHWQRQILFQKPFLILLRRPTQLNDWQMRVAANMLNFDVEMSAWLARHERMWPSTG
jgi:hypothetical protein